jgi:hypothetical protein
MSTIKSLLTHRYKGFDWVVNVPIDVLGAGVNAVSLMALKSVLLVGEYPITESP